MDRLYQLECDVQHYAWGGRCHGNRKPFIADLLNIQDPGDEPFAELWIGAHPKMPAQVLVNADKVPLNSFIKEAPEEVLGQALTERKIAELPFLLKVLHCERPLSIQAHPDIELAQELHARDPEHYPDANHKPEIAIALTDFKALCQFRDRYAIAADLARYAPLRHFFETEDLDPSQKRWLRTMYARIFHASEESVRNVLEQQHLALHQSQDDALTAEDECFVELLNQSPGDRGCLSAYFLNLVHLHPGEALFLQANEPHAYMDGVIIECMANSDNVVRAGLTSKFIDTNTLLQMLTYKDGPPDVFTGSAITADIRSYVPPVPEFRVDLIQPSEGEKLCLNSGKQLSLLLVLDGSFVFSWSDGKATADRGSIWLWPGSIPQLQVSATAQGGKLVRATPNIVAVEPQRLL